MICTEKNSKFCIGHYYENFTLVHNIFFVITLQDGTTPLMFSVARGHFDCVQELLEQGADPNARRFEVIQLIYLAINIKLNNKML